MQIPSDIKTKHAVLCGMDGRPMGSVTISAADLIRLDRVAQANEATRRALADELGTDEDLNGKLSSATMAAMVLDRLGRTRSDAIQRAGEIGTAKGILARGAGVATEHPLDVMATALVSLLNNAQRARQAAEAELEEWRNGTRKVQYASGIRVETRSESSGTATYVQEVPPMRHVAAWTATNNIEKGDVVMIDMDRGTATSVGKPGYVQGSYCPECAAGRCGWHTPRSTPLEDLKKADATVRNATPPNHAPFSAVGAFNAGWPAPLAAEVEKQKDRAEHAESSLKIERKWHEEALEKLRKAEAVEKALLAESAANLSRAKKAEATLKIERAHDTRRMIENLTEARAAISGALDLANARCKGCGKRFVRVNPEGNCGACSPCF